jgi:aryl-phospho-beta-D-glucosidase BglC (GH1 family)
LSLKIKTEVYKMKKDKTKRISIFTIKLFFLPVVLLLCAGGLLAAAENDDWLHTEGNKIKDSSGHEVWLTGINWFGYEENEKIFHGLWTRDLKGTLDLIADMGFNLIRVPIHARLVDSWINGVYPMPQSITTTNGINEYLAGLDSLKILDYAVQYCGQIGLKIMLDMHSIDPHGYMNEGVWYLSDFGMDKYIACWKFLGEHFKNTDVVIACDLKNEPHDGSTEKAKWDDSADPTNWKKASTDIANAIHSVNPNVLIVIEGVQSHTDASIQNINTILGITVPDWWDLSVHNTWWGGNLMGVKKYPVTLTKPGKVVYSPHDYGPLVYQQPWFFSGFTRETMVTVWGHYWFYIYTDNTAPLLIGEWGGSLDNGDNQRWLGYLRDHIKTYKIHHTFWCLNPNSGDTGGILNSDWTSVNTTKYNIVKSALWSDAGGKFIGLDHAVNLGKNGTNVTAYYGGTVITPTPTATPTPTQTSNDLMGDVNGSGGVNIVDAMVIAQYVSGLNPQPFNALVADFKASRAIDIND